MDTRLKMDVPTSIHSALFNNVNYGSKPLFLVDILMRGIILCQEKFVRRNIVIT